MISLGPLADTLKVTAGRGRSASWWRSGRLHGDVYVARVGLVVELLEILVHRAVSARPGLATEVALEPLGGLEFTCLVLLLEVQGLFGKGVLPGVCRARLFRRLRRREA